MATFQVRANDNVDIDKKPRVYFTCHPEDFEKYFEIICKDVFEAVKPNGCAIYYTDDLTEEIADDEKEVDLGRSNLFVVPVTFKLLSEPNRAMDQDVPYAVEHHIPVLPVMMESGIDDVYSRDDKFGEMQYLDPNKCDPTEISYEDKLKKHLGSVLVGGKMVERIRKAFDAYIFLSYRKKDRKYANELMRLIHSDPECRDIAIWFDEFLTPGESFREGIERVLEKSDLFTLLVTPHLLEKVVDEQGTERDNYVISNELPAALESKKKKDTGILAVEMEKTNREELNGKLNGIEEGAADIVRKCYVKTADEGFRTQLCESICKIATTENNSPEHNFLIGLAYLAGIDVEVDFERGVELITAAAEAGLSDAMARLRRMYQNGEGVCVDYHLENYWAKRIVDYCVENYGKESFETSVALNDAAISYHHLGDYRTALKLREEACQLCCKTRGEDDVETLIMLSGLTQSYVDHDDYGKAVDVDERIYRRLREVLGERDPNTLAALNNLANVHAKLGKHKKAVEIFEKVYDQMRDLLGKEHRDTVRVLNNLANAWCESGDPQKAVEMYEKSYPLMCRVHGEDDPATLTVSYNLAAARGDLGDYEKALEAYEDVYQRQCKTLGERHPDTLRTLINFAGMNSEIGNYEKALEMNERAYRHLCNTFGEQHQRTLSALNNLAGSYGKTGNRGRARELFEKAYLSCCNALGEEHPDTIETLNSLAYMCEELGDNRIALEHFEKVYWLRCKVQGKDTPDTLDTMDRLVLGYTRFKAYPQMLEFLEKSYVLRHKLLGREHPDTTENLNNLLFVADKLGETERIRELLAKVHAKKRKKRR